MSSRSRTWEILEPGHRDDPASRWFDAFILTLIVLNVTAVMLETVPSIRARWATAFGWFEAVSVAVFSIEYLLRLWSAPADQRFRGAVAGRLRWAITPMAIVDLLAVLPSYLPFLGLDLRVARALRLMRLFRLAKLGRYMSSLRLFGHVAREKREELVLTTFLLFLMLLISASVMYYAENAAQPDLFSSIPATMWWAVATLTTVGYGDMYPVTAVGQLFGAFVAILGIGLFALPTAILGSGFVDAIAERKAQRDKHGPTCPHCGGEL